MGSKYKSAHKPSSSTPVLPKTGTRGKSRPADEHQTDDDCAGLSAEGKIIYSLLSSKLQSIIDRLDLKDERMEKLEVENATLRRDLNKLTERMDGLENRERNNDIIISGNAVPAVRPGENTKQVSIDLIRYQLSYSIPSDVISSAHRLNNSNSLNQKNILLKFVGQETKNDVMQACRRTKPSGLYIRDNLTPTRAKILFSLRQLKKRSDRIEFCGSSNGRVFAWVKPVSGQGTNRKVFVSNEEVLNKICVEELGLDPLELLQGNDSLTLQNDSLTLQCLSLCMLSSVPLCMLPVHAVFCLCMLSSMCMLSSVPLCMLSSVPQCMLSSVPLCMLSSVTLCMLSSVPLCMLSSVPLCMLSSVPQCMLSSVHPVHAVFCPPVHAVFCPVHAVFCPPVHAVFCPPVHAVFCPPVHAVFC